ncbi:uncharacterized protein IL334_005303 [Kwoniella shivajii]|uniref:Calpain catalytic domain-containing protein n=1 Tax=Kwoniella shivajii TaxID=564305 RepID=A0ABZ1D409_9TREE|nr:hypothetical protein IL334_005303 [Kwoniella shivajii]
MTTYAFIILFLSLFNILYTTASPTLQRRGAGPLYRPDGIPVVDDVQQHHLDCAYVASVITLLRAPDYIKSLIHYQGNFNSVSEVIVTSYDIHTLKPVDQVVTLDEIYLRNDTKGNIWWPGALYRAPGNAKLVVDPMGEFGMPTMTPGDAMQLLTGRRAKGDGPEDIADFWDIIKGVQESPMVLQTKGEGCTILLGRHAYAIANATEVDGVRTVGLINTDGKDSLLSVDEAFSDFYLLWSSAALSVVCHCDREVSAAALWCLSLIAGQAIASPFNVPQRPFHEESLKHLNDEVITESDQAILDLLGQYAPVFKLSSLEAFYPSSVDYMFPHYNYTEGSPGEITPLNQSYLTRTQLDKLPSAGSGSFLSISERHNPQPLLDEDAEYLFGPAGQEDAMKFGSDGRGRVEEEVYGFAVDQGKGVVDLWYWTFYPFNFGKPVGLFGILGNHVADWEHLRMRTINGTAVSADYTTHTGGRFNAGTFRWEDIEKIDDRPVAYVAAGSHGVGKLFQLVDLTDDEGPIWDTKNHVVPTMYWYSPESRRRVWHRGDQSWLNFRGWWGNRGETDCWWHRVVGFCQVVDAPGGPNRGFGFPPDCTIAPLTDEFSTYKFRFSSSAIDWAKTHNVALVKVEQTCTRPKRNPDDDDDGDEPDEPVNVYRDEVEGELEVWNVKGLTEFKGTETHTVTIDPCKGRQSAVRAYKLSLCLLNGKCLTSSQDRRVCTFEQGKKGYKFGSAVMLDDTDDWRWNY